MKLSDLKRMRQSVHREMQVASVGVGQKDLDLINIHAKGIAHYINKLPQRGRETSVLQWCIVLCILDAMIKSEKVGPA